MDFGHVLFLGNHDWSNLCNRVARAINLVAGETIARVWTLNSHQFGYEEDVTGEHCSDDLLSFAQSVDWVFSTGDGDYWYFDRMKQELGIDARVHEGTTHAGSAYRAASDLYNEADASRGFERRFIGLDSLRFARGDDTVRPYYSLAPCLVPSVVPTDGRLRIAHAPSNRATKGTDRILEALYDLDGVEVDLIENVDYRTCSQRLSRCHVLVDQMNPSIGGLGALAIEAMGLGLAVVSDCRNIDAETWSLVGGCPVSHVETDTDLRNLLSRWVRDLQEVRSARDRSLQWAKAYASPEAIAKLWDLPRGRRLEHRPNPSVPKISAPMIVRDEEQGIRRALESLATVVDEVVIVDTGSVDRTMEIAREVASEWSACDAKRPSLRFLYEPWRDDFSFARNVAQDACTGDWCVILDGDEVLEPGDLRASIHAARNHAVDHLSILFSGMLSQVRAYRRDRFHWEKPVHNQLVSTKECSIAAPSTATICEGYHKPMKFRCERSKPMLLRLYDAEPSSMHAPTYLAKLHLDINEPEEARRWARVALACKAGDLVYSAMATFVDVVSTCMIDGTSKGIPVVEKALEDYPWYADLWHLRANLSIVHWVRCLRSKSALCITHTNFSPDRIDRGCRELAFPLIE